MGKMCISGVVGGVGVEHVFVLYVCILYVYICIIHTGINIRILQAMVSGILLSLGP